MTKQSTSPRLLLVVQIDQNIRLEERFRQPVDDDGAKSNPRLKPKPDASSSTNLQVNDDDVRDGLFLLYAFAPLLLMVLRSKE